MDWLKNYIASLRFEFVGHAKPVAVFSLAAVLLSWFLVFVTPILGLPLQPKWGIDFTGGTEVQLRFQDDIQIAELRASLDEIGIPSDSVTEVSASGSGALEFKVRIQDPEFGSKDLQAEVRERLTGAFGAEWVDHIDFNPEVGARFAVFYHGDKVAPSAAAKALEGIEGVKVEEGREDRELVVKFSGLADQVKKQIGAAMGDHSYEVLSVDAVGPKVGASLRQQGILSIVATLGLILVYVAFRFDLAYAPGAVLALIHDVSVTAGLFVLMGKEFNLTLVGALLTVLGYSLNDTIVIYDRIRENRTRYSRRDLRELVNQSINETLTRTFATAGTTLVSTCAFLFLGTDVIHDFVLAITLGIVLGTYSTIYVASPAILVTEHFRPWLERLLVPPANATTADDDGIPEQFISQSEKRRMEREKLIGQNEPGKG
jgi:preprotein translocase subunit SecF